MGIKHKVVKAPNEQGLSSEWNDNHKIDSDVEFAGHSGINLGEPISPSDIATKNYVDTKVGGSMTFQFNGTGSAGGGYNRWLSPHPGLSMQGSSSNLTRLLMPRNGKVKYLSVWVSSYTAAFTVYINGVATSLSVTTVNQLGAAYSSGISFNAGDYIEIVAIGVGGNLTIPVAYVGVVLE